MWALESNDLALNAGSGIFQLCDTGHCFNLFQPQVHICKMWIIPASQGSCETQIIHTQQQHSKSQTLCRKDPHSHSFLSASVPNGMVPNGWPKGNARVVTLQCLIIITSLSLNKRDDRSGEMTCLAQLAGWLTLWPFSILLIVYGTYHLLSLKKIYSLFCLFLPLEHKLQLA